MDKASILIVDDEIDILDTIQDILIDEGYKVTICKNGSEAKIKKQDQHYDLILMDIWMPDIDGVTLLKQWVGEGLNTPVIMMSGHATIETAIEATKLGAYDFLEKPLSMTKLLLIVKKAINYKIKPGAKNTLFEVPIGKSKVINNLKSIAAKLAQTDTNVLISGDNGSGKKAFANYIYLNSKRASKPLIEVGSANILKDNADIELFGSEKGSKVFIGLLEKANHGVLIFDEISKLNQKVQVKLASALKTKSFLRVGGNSSIEFDIRVIALTNVDLKDNIKNNKFNEDLFYVLNSTYLNIPTLSEHKEDVPDLLNYYVDLYCETEKLKYRKIPLDVKNKLINYDWNGNIAELKNLVYQLLTLGGDELVSLKEVDDLLNKAEDDDDSANLINFNLELKDARKIFDKNYFLYHLDKNNYNISKVAQIAGMERTTLYRKLKSLGIEKNKLTESSKK